METLTIEAVADEAGLPITTAELVWHLWSRILGRHAGQRLATTTIQKVIADLVRLTFKRGGAKVAAPHPSFDPTSRSPKTAMRRLGLTVPELDLLWTRACATSIDRPLMPLDIVIEFFPLKWWAPAATVISWGADETASRLTMLVHQWKQEPQRATRTLDARVGAAPKTITTRMALARGVMQRLIGMRQNAIPSDGLLDAWMTMPSSPDILETDSYLQGARTISDRSGPPLMAIRRSLRLTDRTVKDSQRTKYGRVHRLRLLRGRALRGLLLLTGSRIDARLSRPSWNFAAAVGM